MTSGNGPRVTKKSLRKTIEVLEDKVAGWRKAYDAQETAVRKAEQRHHATTTLNGQLRQALDDRDADLDGFKAEIAKWKAEAATLADEAAEERIRRRLGESFMTPQQLDQVAKRLDEIQAYDRMEVAS